MLKLSSSGEEAKAEGPVSLAQKTLVQTSFAQVEPIAEAAAELFYGRLFALDPSLRRLFKGDMTAQGRKLMAMAEDFPEDKYWYQPKPEVRTFGGMLLHVGAGSERTDKMHPHLGPLIAALRQRGYSFARVDELLTH